MLSAELMRAIRHIEIRTRHLVNDSLAGEYQAIFKGRGMEFEEVRQYQPGDDIRSIDWNVTARTGEPYVKSYVEERELTVLLAFDASASGLFGSQERLKRELAAEIGAVLAFSAISNKDKVGLIAFTDDVELHIPPRKGRRHVLRLIRDLLVFEPQGRGTNITRALDHINHTLKRRAIIFLISDFLIPYEQQEVVEAHERLLLVTSRRHDLVAVSITDPREMAWPNAGLVALEDAEDGSQLIVDSSSAHWRDVLAGRAAEWRNVRDRAFSRAQVDHIPVQVGEEYIGPMLAFFERRARRRRR